MRFPVNAKKDSKVEKITRVTHLESVYLSTTNFGSEEIDSLFFASRYLCPHNWLDDEVYYTAIGRIVSDCSSNKALRDNCSEFSSMLLKKKLLTKKPNEALQLLVSIERSTPFRTFLKTLIYYLYGDPIVWGGCGYEGVLGCNEDGERDGINDIDWLPEPPEDLN